MLLSEESSRSMGAHQTVADTLISGSRNAICRGGRKVTTTRHSRAAAADGGTTGGVFALGHSPGGLYGHWLSSA